VLEKGRIAQLGQPAELYRHPVNSFTASFLGDINLIAGELSAPGVVTTKLGVFRGIDSGNAAVGDAVQLAIRPETVAVDPDFECAWQGDLALTGGSYLGEMAAWQFGELAVNEIAPEVRQRGEICRLGVRSSNITVFDANGVKA